MTESQKSGSPSAAIICCIEKGGLEAKGLCMLLSLRSNWGGWKDVPIYAYSPRVGYRPSQWMLDFYKTSNVVLVDEPINAQFADYPLANKPLSMAHAEEHLTEEYLVFLDSDILCWSEPSGLAIPRNKSLAMVPDFTKTVASSGPLDSRYESMWQQLYRIANVRQDPYVTTLLTDERVRGWWNTGVIVCRRSDALMSKWLQVFRVAMSEVEFPPEARYLREQICLCGVAAAEFDRFTDLSVAYNYPIQNYPHYMRRGTAPQSACLWHYQPYLNKAFRKLRSALDRTNDLGGKLRIAEAFLEVIKVGYPGRLGLDESLFTRWRQALALGPRLRAFIGKPKPTDPLL